jgi:aminoglycoside phosphotransferase family enzyme
MARMAGAVLAMKAEPIPAARAPEPDLAAKLAFLRRPEAFPHAPQRVEAVETHLSWVFLAGDRVYKLKKPVAHAFGDLTTVEGRRRNCLDELALNRRFAPQVYLDVVPLTRDDTGALRLGGDGTAVDWLVAMRRLPQDATLEARLRDRRATPDDIASVAGCLARFYRDAEPVPADPDLYCDGFAARGKRECAFLRNPGLGLPPEAVRAAANRLRAFLAADRPLLRARAAEGRIVEGHGDLRPEHVFLMPEPVIIDCLEFSRALRLLDPADELAYLAMECARLGGGWVRATLFQAYSAHSGDRVAPALVDFHWTIHALRRARQAAERFGEMPAAQQARWRRQALDYLALAAGCER